MPVHNWRVGVLWPASGMEPERRSGERTVAKRVEACRGTFVGDPILP